LGWVYQKFPTLHPYLLRFPIFGKFQKLIIQEAFIRTFLSLVIAKIPLVAGLGLMRDVSTCFPYKAAIARAKIRVASGRSLSSCLKDDEVVFGGYLLAALEFAEKTGRAVDTLTPLSEELGEQLVDTIDTLSALLEPLLMAFVGAVVGLVMMALFLPIFSMAKVIH
jgi:type IV pilus assembly protein PilC